MLEGKEPVIPVNGFVKKVIFKNGSKDELTSVYVFCSGLFC